MLAGQNRSAHWLGPAYLRRAVCRAAGLRGNARAPHARANNLRLPPGVHFGHRLPQIARASRRAAAGYFPAPHDRATDNAMGSVVVTEQDSCFGECHRAHSNNHSKLILEVGSNAAKAIRLPLWSARGWTRTTRSRERSERALLLVLVS